MSERTEKPGGLWYLGEVFRRVRLNSEMSLGDAARWSKLSRSTIRNVEKGRSFGNVETLVRLSEAYGVTLSRVLAQCEEIAREA